MATLDVLKKACQLKVQLKASTEPSTVLKILKNLKELEITLDILSETGIGKVVNSLRKNGDVGEMAKSIVKDWKKLVPKESSRNTEGEKALQQLDSQSNGDSQKSQINGGLATDTDNQNQETIKTTNRSWDASMKLCLKEEKICETSERKLSHEEEKQICELLGHLPSEQDSQNILPEEHTNGKVLNKGATVDRSIASKKRFHYDSDNDGCSNLQSDHRKTKHLSRKDFNGSSDSEKRCNTTKGSNKKLDPTKTSIKVSFKESSKSESNSKELRTVNDCRKKASKMHNETPSFEGKNKKPSEKKQVCVKEKRKPDDRKLKSSKTAEEKVEKKKDEKACSKINFEDPAMSFESYLSYDLNSCKRKKKFKVNKNPPKKAKSVEMVEGPTRSVSAQSVKVPKIPDNISPSKMVTKGSVMDLLNIPLPSCLPECDDPYFNYFERKVEEKASVCDVLDESPIFTGQRLNQKMQVYSGAKTTFLPTMLTLYQQCIRALQNNIDMLYEIGGVPFDILEPVLERCTPDQLLRIEECNPVYIGLTDHLWERHCQKDFRDSQLEEYESWKEMYIRLFEERERKLQRLTKTIVSAHSGKPKGRQVKLAFIHSVAKPPRNVRIQQEIHGTAGAIHQPHPLDKPSVKVNSTLDRSRLSIEPARPSTNNAGTGSAQDARKKGKGVAPMMAKSLKAFKKQLGRR